MLESQKVAITFLVPDITTRRTMLEKTIAAATKASMT